MTLNAKKVFGFLHDNYGSKLTHRDIAEALGISSSTVTGSVNGLCKKGYASRTEEHMEGPDGKDITIKYISLTEEGMAFDPEAAEEEK